MLRPKRLPLIPSMVRISVSSSTQSFTGSLLPSISRHHLSSIPMIRCRYTTTSRVRLCSSVDLNAIVTKALLYTLADAALASPPGAANGPVQRRGLWFGLVTGSMELISKESLSPVEVQVQVPYAYGFAVTLLTLLVRVAAFPMTKQQMGNISGHGRRSNPIEEPLITSPRIRLSDGRFLAYRETGVPKEEAKFRIIISHGFGSSKDMSFLAPQELIESLKIYILLYDRAGYGESDLNPKRSVKSEAQDIEQLADQLQLGSKFYVIGVSLGSYPIWSCLYYIPHRLQGVALVAPVVNYRWSSLPHKLTKEDFRKKLVKLAYWFLKHVPGLLFWWMTQKLFPPSNVMEKNPVFFNEKDQEVLKRTPGFELLSKNKLENKSVFENLRRDLMVGFSKWEFDPLKLSNPFPELERSVHLWAGYEDRVVPIELQRHVSGTLAWIKHHEVPHGGHLIVYDSEVCESILRALLLDEEPDSFVPSSAILVSG